VTPIGAAPPEKHPAARQAARTPELRGGWARAAFRIPAIGAWTAVSFLVWSVGSLITLPLPRQRLHWRQRMVRTWARGVARLVGMRARFLGPAPRAPFFLATNHLSYMDIILLYTRLSGVFVAKREMRSWPVLGPIAHLAGTIWVKREVRRDAIRVLDQIDEAIARGDGVILFAEGTTSAGEALLPMRPALFDWAAREQYPVHYAAITYRTRPGTLPARHAICWWGEMAFGRHIVNLCRLRGFEAEVEFGPEPLTAPTRGELAERVQREVDRRFVPVTGSERIS